MFIKKLSPQCLLDGVHETMCVSISIIPDRDFMFQKYNAFLFGDNAGVFGSDWEEKINGKYFSAQVAI